MNCREYEQRWNEALDARSDGLPDLGHSLELHRASCEACQAVSARYQVLRQAVSSWGPPPTLSAESRDRLRRLSVAPTPPKIAGRWRRWAVPLATAAAIIGLVGFYGPWSKPSPPPQIAPASSIAVLKPSRPIESALERATSETINLAIEASAPAARIGRDVLTFEDPVASPATSGPETDLGSAVAAVSATEMLQTVGDRVKPLSGSARHAFSFLLGPPPGSDKPAVAPRDSL